MKEWNEFLKKLNNYERNREIENLKDDCKIFNSKVQVKKIDDYILFKSAIKCANLKFYPEKNQIEIISESHSSVRNFTRKRLIYRVSFNENFIKISSSKVYNIFTKCPGGYQLSIICHANTRTFNKNGFEISNNGTIINTDKQIFIPKKTLEAIDMVIPNSYYERENDYQIFGLRHNQLSNTYEYSYTLVPSKLLTCANQSELKGLIVDYSHLLNNERENFIFPAFFNHDKTIMTDPFKSDKSLQIYDNFLTEFKEVDYETISFENHTYDDALEYIQKRHTYQENLENNTNIDPDTYTIIKYLKKQ